jgi:hypothetical protein
MTRLPAHSRGKPICAVLILSEHLPLSGFPLKLKDGSFLLPDKRTFYYFDAEERVNKQIEELLILGDDTVTTFDLSFYDKMSILGKKTFRQLKERFSSISSF